MTTPPQNLEAEESVVGAMLLSAAVCDEVQEYVGPDDFYRESHGTIFRVACDMHDREVPVDVVTVSNELERLGLLNSVGGKPKLHELAALMPATGNATHYARIVKDQALLRGLTRAGTEISALGHDAPGAIDELLGRAEVALSNVTLKASGASARPLTDALEEYLDTVRESYRTKIPQTGTLTRFAELDSILLGFWPEQLIIIAARPSEGKSTLALNIAENFVDHGDPVLFVSLEMSRAELQERALARAARVDSYKLRSGQMTDVQAKRLPEGIATVKRRGETLLVNTEGSITLPALKAEAVRLHRTKGIKLIVVDYLQLMTPPKAENRNLEIGAISRGLKLLAKRLGIPIVAVSQLSREGTKGKPGLHHLRDSGSLEQDADVVIFLHDPAGDNDALDKTPDGSVDIIVAKNRKGRKDDTKLNYVKRYSSFYSNTTTTTGEDE